MKIKDLLENKIIDEQELVILINFENNKDQVMWKGRAYKIPEEFYETRVMISLIGKQREVLYGRDYLGLFYV